jgi:8-oxo-dGTP pyrophosphatase MutT (NUDIX family)
MHIGRHIVQELVLSFGEPVVERWEHPLSETELDEVERHRSLGRAHDVTIAIVDGERLAVIRKRGYPEGAYRIPSGGIHPEESFVDGATREALEETGLSVRIEDYPLQIHADFVCGERHARWTTHVMLARVLSTSEGEPRHRDAEEIESARWIRWRELIDEVNPVLRNSGRGGLRYRARLHERLHEIVHSTERTARPVVP